MAKRDQSLLNLKKSLVIDGSNQRLYGTSSDPTKADFDKLNKYAYQHKNSALSKEIGHAYQLTDNKDLHPTYMDYEHALRTGDFITPNISLNNGAFKPLNKDDFVNTKADQDLAHKASKALDHDQHKEQASASESPKDAKQKSQAVNQDQESASASSASQSSRSSESVSNDQSQSASSAQTSKSESAQTTTSNQSEQSQESQSSAESSSDVKPSSESEQRSDQAKDRSESQSSQATSQSDQDVKAESQSQEATKPKQDSHHAKPADKKPSRIDYLHKVSEDTKKLTNDMKTYLSDAQKYRNNKPIYHMFKHTYTGNPNYNKEYHTVRVDSAHLKANANRANLSNKKQLSDHIDTMVAIMSEDYAKGMPFTTNSVVHDVSKGEIQVAQDIKAEKQAKQKEQDEKRRVGEMKKQNKILANTRQQKLAPKQKATRADYLHNTTVATRALNYDATQYANYSKYGKDNVVKDLIHTDVSCIESNANASKLPNKDQIHNACKAVDQQAFNGNGSEVYKQSHNVINQVSKGEMSIAQSMKIDAQKKQAIQKQAKEQAQKRAQVAKAKARDKNRQVIAKPNSSLDRKGYLHNVSIASTNLVQDAKKVQKSPQNKQLKQKIQLDLQGIDNNADAGDLANKSKIHQECSYVEQQQSDSNIVQHSKAIYGDVTRGEVQVLRETRKQHIAQQAPNQTNQPNQSNNQIDVNRITQAVDRASAESSRDQTQTQAQPNNQKPSKPTQKTYLHNVSLSTEQLAKDMHTFDQNMIMRSNDPKADVHNNINYKTIKDDVDYIKQNAIKGHMPNQDQIKQTTSNLYINVFNDEPNSSSSIPRNQKELKSVFDSVSKGEISIVQAKKRAIQGTLKPNLQHGMSQSGASLNSNPASKLNRKFHPTGSKKIDHQPKQESLFGTPNQSKEKQAKIKINKQGQNLK